MIHPHAKEQLVRWCLGSGLGYDRLHVVHCLRRPKVQGRLFQACPGKVDVAIDKAWQHSLTSQIDWRRLSGVGCDFFPRPYGNDSPIAHGQGFGAGLSRVHGDDIGPAQDQIAKMY
jgi:hypothetical protein